MKFFICVLGIMAMAMADETNLEILFRDGNNHFTGKMFAEVVKEQPSKNIVISAYSAMAPLAQLSLAAVGATHDQLLSALGLPNDTATKTIFPVLKSQLESTKRITLKQANKIYLPIGLELEDDFRAISKDVFASEMQNINFIEQEKAATEINTWVEKQTNSCIKELVKAESFNEDTRIVLVNAIYFKGSWQNKFLVEKTQDCDFHVSKNKTIKVPTMTQKNHFKFGKSDELHAELLLLQYDGDDTSMLIILPKDEEDLSALVEKLKDPSIIHHAVEKMYLTEIEIFIPKFKIETVINLKETFANIGLRSLFDPMEVHLDKLVKSKAPIVVTDAVQKAFIEVNEDGSEAAASSAIFTAQRASFNRPPFIADRPFVFSILKNQLNLFTGLFKDA